MSLSAVVFTAYRIELIDLRRRARKEREEEGKMGGEGDRHSHAMLIYSTTGMDLSLDERGKEEREWDPFNCSTENTDRLTCMKLRPISRFVYLFVVAAANVVVGGGGNGQSFETTLLFFPWPLRTWGLWTLIFFCCGH